MKVIAPRTVTDAVLSSTNLVETDNAPYAPTTTYAKGARVRRASVFDFTSGALPGGATLARASSGTYTASNGLIGVAAANVARFEYAAGACLGLLIEPQRTNTLTYSEQFDNAFWQKIGSSPGTAPIVTANATASPDLGVTADRLQFQAGASGSGLSILVPGASSVTAGTVYAGSIFVKLTSAPSGSMATYLQNQGTGNLTSGAQVLSSVWTRVGLQRTSDSNAMFFVFGAYPDFGGDRAIDVSLWGAQLEDGPRTSYIPTTTATATRAADVVTLNWASKGATDGAYTARYTFDDGSTQDLPATVSSGVSTVPTASLNRTIVARVQLTALLDGVRVYESVQANNLGHPLTDPAWWLDVGPTNRWAMFDGAVGSLSRATGSISVTLRPDVAIDALAVLEVTAASVRVQINAGGASVYDQTKLAGTAPASLLFLGLPIAVNATVVVTIAGTSGATPVSAGALIIGNLADLGLTEAGPSIGINDFSKRQTDDFGVTTVVERGWAKRMSIRSKIETTAVADLQQRLTTLRALPSLWIGEEGYDSLVIYGFFKEFAVDLALETISYCTLTIEGMTTASDLDQETTAGDQALAAQVATAVAEIAVMQSDAYLSAGEKPDIIRRVADIVGESPEIVARAGMLAVSSTAYTAAYSALSAYLNGLVPAYTDTASDTPIAPATFNGRFGDYYLARTTLLNAITAKAATLATWSGTTGVGKPADNADVTALSQIVIGQITPIAILANSSGVIAAGTFPITALAQVTKGGVDIHADASVTYALANIAPTLDITINSSSDKGRITLNNATGSGTAQMIATVAGIAQPPEKITVTVTNAPATGGGSAGGAASGPGTGDVSGQNVTSASYTRAIVFTGVAVPSGKSIKATLAAQYNIRGAAAGSQAMLAKARYAPTGTTTWTDIAAAVTGSVAGRDSADGDSYSGSISISQTAAPSAATYDVEIVVALQGGTRQLGITSGPVSVAVI